MTLADVSAPQKKVRVLPADLVNKIAAGEVIERPASVVKELVENALDAGATRIEITAGAGGRTIRVADNGIGMAPDDLERAFLNHATSKLLDEADLFALRTLGFRGEALASIAAISRLTAISRTAQASVGTRLEFPDSSSVPPLKSDVGAAVGTSIAVDELFFNTPARLKFLKRPQTELAHLEEVVQTLALSRPDVAFTLVINGQSAFSTRGDGQLKAILAALYRLDAKAQDALIFAPPIQEPLGKQSSDAPDAPDVPDTPDTYSLEALLASPAAQSLPGVFRAGKKPWHLFANGRAIRCSVMQRAIESAYQSLIPEGRYPLVALRLTLPPGQIDVNVHPTKKEVRYADPQRVFTVVRHTLRRALEAVAPQMLFALPPRPEGLLALDARQQEARPMPALTVQWPLLPSLSEPVSASHAGAVTHQPSVLSGSALVEEPDQGLAVAGSETFPDWRVIGQLFNTYILLETRQGLMVVDQHIASERALFEMLTLRVQNAEVACQQVLSGVPLPLTPTQIALLTTYQPTLAALGFSYTLDAAAGHLILSAYPSLYPDRQHEPPTQWLMQLLTTLEAQEGQALINLGQDLLIATLACHTAVRAGDALTTPQMAQLVRDWLACQLPWSCPHGRPIAHTIRSDELNRFFDRSSLPVNAFG